MRTPAMAEAHVDEQRSGIGVGIAGVHRGERVIEAAEQEIVDGGQQDVRLVTRRRRGANQVEHACVGCDGLTDPRVQA